MAKKQIEKELQDDKKKIEKDHATLKEKEARYQRMVSLVSKEDATKEKSIIKEEEESTCLTESDIKKSYTGSLKDTFTKGGERKVMDYIQYKYISPYKGNDKRNLYNSSTILDEIWSKQRLAHDRIGLGYKKDK